MRHVEDKLESYESASKGAIMEAISIIKSRAGELRHLQWEQRKEESFGRC